MNSKKSPWFYFDSSNIECAHFTAGVLSGLPTSLRAVVQTPDHGSRWTCWDSTAFQGSCFKNTAKTLYVNDKRG